MESIDNFDLAILQELQADGRLTNAELSQRVGLSAAPCWRRVRALEEAGVVKSRQ
jgi:DNA-binding Lrp family transcriptional regulator